MNIHRYYCLYSNNPVLRPMIFHSIPVEHKKTVMDLLDIVALSLLAATSKASKTMVDAYNRNKMSKILKPFGLHHDKILGLLSLHQAIIGGRCALLAVLPMWSNVSHKFTTSTPRTIEFVTPRTRFNHFIVDFQQLYPTYTPYTSASPPVSHLFNGESFTLSHKLPHQHRYRVLIHAAANDIAYTPVFKANLTAEINFISHRGAFSAYPTMTSQGYTLSRANNHHADFNRKFRHWGFTIDTYPNICALRGITHEHYRSDLSCPYSIRSTLDNESHFLVITEDIPNVSSNLLPLQMSRPCITWVFNAGRCCGNYSLGDFVHVESHIQQN